MNLAKILPQIRAAAENIKSPLSIDDALNYLKEGEPFTSMFYGNLSDARWLPVLNKAGHFSELPTPIVKGESVNYPRSLPLLGLAHLANEEPHLSLEILGSLPESENPYIVDEIMMCIAQIDDKSCASTSLDLLKNKLTATKAQDWLYLDDVLSKWLQIEAYDEIIELLKVYLLILVQTDDVKRANLGYRLDEIDRKILHSLQPTHHSKLLRMYLQALTQWKEFQKSQEEHSGDDDGDPLTYWLEDFHHRKSYTHEVESILVSKLFALCADVYANADHKAIAELDTLLRKDSWELFNRLRWQLYADFPDKSLKMAKADVVDRIPKLGHYPYSHGYEMAQLLTKHCEAHGHKFLNIKETKRFFNTVMDGGFDYKGDRVPNDDSTRRFKRKQLQPISSLLDGSELLAYLELSKENPNAIPPEGYKPFSSGKSGFVVPVPPKEVAEFAKMSNENLWKFINEWNPESRYESEDWLEEESVGALGEKLGEFIEENQQRFPSETTWWKNIHPSEIFSKLLARATKRIAKRKPNEEEQYTEPTEDEWLNWFGVAEWTLHLAQQASEESRKSWNWPQREVVNFLQASIDPQHPCPDAQYALIGELLRSIVSDTDPALARKELASWGDWLTSAINSVPGTALEALISLAVFQKQHTDSKTPEPWIYVTIHRALTNPEQTPLLFAIMGARLHPVLYLYADQLKDAPQLLLPDDRPTCREAFVTSNIRYGNPMKGVLNIIPSLPSTSLNILVEFNKLKESNREYRSDFGGRLGTHLFSYFWNEDFPDEESANATIDHYFEITTPHQRAAAIADTARIFAKTIREDQFIVLLDRVMQLAERRINQIDEALASESISPEDAHDELSNFINWLECEAFPFKWRHKLVMQAITLLKKAPQTRMLARSFSKFTDAPLRLAGALEIFDALLNLETTTISWSFRDEDIKPLLRKGLVSGDPQTVQLAKSAQETLLRHGCFEFLELDD